MDKKIRGKIGEDLAAVMLEEKGYTILKRNFSCKYGELDIIAWRGRTICFIEVKTRLSDSYGMGREAVDEKKQRHIKNCAEFFLKYTNVPYESVDFQVIEIMLEHITGLSF